VQRPATSRPLDHRRQRTATGPISGLALALVAAISTAPLWVASAILSALAGAGTSPAA